MRFLQPHNANEGDKHPNDVPERYECEDVTKQKFHEWQAKFLPSRTYPKPERKHFCKVCVSGTLPKGSHKTIMMNVAKEGTF